MKTIRFLSIFLVTAFTAARASTTIAVGSGSWGENDMPWGLVINTTGTTFDVSVVSTLRQELVGFSLPAIIAAAPSDPVQIGTSDYAFIRATGDSRTTSGVDGTFFNLNFNYTNGATPNDAAGFLWFEKGTTAVTTNQSFGFQNLNQGLPSDGSNIKSGWEGTPTTTMAFTTVPEPSVVGLAGLAALGMLGRRRQ